MNFLSNIQPEDIVVFADAMIRIVGMVIAFFGAIATARLPGKFKAEGEAAVKTAEAYMREALKEAVATGLSDGQARGMTGAELIRHTFRHAVKSVPDSIIGLTKTPEAQIKNVAVDTAISNLPPKARDAIENIIRAGIQ